MPEPITGSIIAKAIESAGSQQVNTASNLIQRMLGPGCDAFGQALGRSIEYRTRNWGRIADKAARKAQADPDGGVVSARVAYTLLEEGSLCDDELLAEYLGGVLAAGRSHDGRDDRAVTWSRVITGLSALQVRAHYLIYREWADRLHGITELNLGMSDHSIKAMMQINLDEFGSVLTTVIDVDLNVAISHTIPGLSNAGLIGNEYSYGPKDQTSPLGHDAPFENVLCVFPSVLGLELYGWAQGLPGLIAVEFPIKAAVFDTDDPIPRLTDVALPRLHQRDAAAGQLEQQ